MRTIILTILVTGALTAAAETPNAPSPYSGLEERQIKALSPESIEGYENGKGMGYAMAAELNSYPGPKHVLELAEPLALSDEQRRATDAAFETMHAEAVRLGKEIVALERRMDELFASGAMDETQLTMLIAELGRREGELRLAHLRAHLTMRAVLTEEQVAQYDRLRGYGHGAESPAHADCPHGG